MWSAIKSDLFEFVSTVQHETSKTIHLLQQHSNTENATNPRVEEKLKALRDSRDTFSEPISTDDEEAFNIFRAHFSLASEASAVRQLLDTSPSIAEHYHSLVSSSEISAEEFWTRYFYRANKIINRVHSASSSSLPVELLEDEEEEIGWDIEEPQIADTPETATSAPSSEVQSSETHTTGGTTVTTTTIAATPVVTTIVAATPDNEISQLKMRVAELEQQLVSKQIIIDELQHKLATATSMSSFATVSHEHDTDGSNTSSDNKKQLKSKTQLPLSGSDEEEEGWDDSWG